MSAYGGPPVTQDGGAFSNRDSGYTSGLGSGHSGTNPTYDNPQSTNAAPHPLNVATKADPRADSERDHRSARVPHGSNNIGVAHSGYGNSAQYDKPRSAAAGPHDSSAMNKADPRVDSDRTYRGAPTGYSSGNNYGSPTTGNYGASTNNPNYNNPNSSAAGPHSSGLLNKIDPRAGSDRSSSSNSNNNMYGVNQTSYGNNAPNSNEATQISSTAEGHGNGASSGSGGPHRSRLANKLDPKVHSNAGSGKGGGGPATANASVTGSGPTGAPEGQASASGPMSATASTSTTTNPITKGINKLTGRT